MNDERPLQAISELLDSTMGWPRLYQEVAQNYGLHNDEISLVLEENDRSPTTALIQWLAATRPELTVQEFAAAAREKAKREDVVALLKAYDSSRLNRLTDAGKHLKS